MDGIAYTTLLSILIYQEMDAHYTGKTTFFSTFWSIVIKSGGRKSFCIQKNA